MLTSKKLATLSALAVLPLAFWLNGASASTFVYHQDPIVLKKADRMLLRGEPDRAIELLSATVDDLQRPNMRSKGHAILCKAQHQKQDYMLAEEHCDQAVKQGGPNWSNLNNRGVMRFLLGRYDDALTDFNHAASIMMVSATKSQNRSVKNNIASAKLRLSERQEYAVASSVVSGK
jgi:Flp pilus assembly protein TadD